MSAAALLRPGIAAEEAMKKAFVLAVCLGLGTAALANVKTESIKVSGWKCEKCPAKTEAKLKAVNGVESASADREKGQVVVKYDDSKVKKADLEKAIADSGFTAAK
jgi:copper chaperone CopZ